MPAICTSEALRRFCISSLTLNGMNNDDASAVADVLVTTEMWGIHTHGIKNLYGYICKKNAGGVSFTAQPEEVISFPSLAVIDGKNAMGYVSATKAIHMACEMSEKTGVAIVLVKNSCHFGATGYYANEAVKYGKIGIVASNVDKKMSIPGAKGMIMGHNPFAFAAPTRSMPSVMLDISSSNVASLRVLKAKHNGEQIPGTWISDKDGVPTTDPGKYPDEGALLPMGNHKGYGIALFIEILTSILLGTPNSTEDEVYSWCFDLDKPNNVSHIFAVINPKLIDDGTFPDRVEKLVAEIHNAPKAKGFDRIKVPGEDMWEQYEKSIDYGIELPDDVLEEICKIEDHYGIKLETVQG